MEVQEFRGVRPGARWAAYLLMAAGTLVLLGWLENISILMTVLPGKISMKPNTAVGFLCAGVCIVLLGSRSAARRSRLLGTALAGIIIVVGLLTLLEYAFHFDLGIDQLLFKDILQNPYPGRMAHITAFNFCLVGLSLLLLSISRTQAWLSQILSLLSGLSALLAIVGYSYGVPLLDGSIRYTSMAIHTGAGFLLLSVAILHCRPSDGLMAVVTSSYSGGWLSRRLIPVAIVVPVVLGAISIHTRFALSDTHLALACLMVSQVVLFVGLIWTLALWLNRSEIARYSAKHALQESEKQLEQNYRSMFEEALIGLFQTTPEGKFLSVNPAMARIFGYESPAQMVASITDIPTQMYVDPKRRDELKQQMEENGSVQNFEFQVFRKDGTKMWLTANCRAIYQDGSALRYDGTLEDMTEHKLLEDQLRQAQKMEAVGRLAGGVAHDFNNAIGVIVGYSALLKEGLSCNDTLHRYADEVDKAGHRAASLTRQLLAFSRKQVIQPTIIDLNAVVTETEKMLRRLIGEDIQLSIIRDPNLARVRADLGQIEQILMNLAVNARDAMPQGGRLVIQTANTELDETNLRKYSYAKPGRYVMFSVSDTGCGMDKETQAHIFEPFFTTKGPAQGTGLGLSTVYGIVKQSCGYVWVYSEPGKGATFKVYFPLVEAAADPIAQAEKAEVPRGSETILVVEDDESMRALTRNCLESGGYTVLDACDTEAAIQTVTQYDGVIHLLLTDVVMPGISGPQLSKSLAVSRPNMKVLFMSGYTADLIAQHGVLDPQIVLLEKPFTRDALLGKIRKVLDTGHLGASAGH
jgi:two-component system cell cycle sensor histidine kinase/response regulator CckA